LILIFNIMFHPFVLPFSIGFTMMLTVLTVRYTDWLRGLSVENRKRLMCNLFTIKTWEGLGEIFRESLLHLKIYKTNPVLGFMHMSLAFGWFLLILGGKLETWYYSGDFANPVYYAIFFRYFEPVTSGFWMNGVMVFFMDFSLLLVLTGVVLAFAKRLRRKLVGMQNTTRHSLGNRVALTFLWFIFPLRLLAESVTAGQHSGGGFLTASLGEWLLSGSWAASAEVPLWWAYSFSLGLFFLALPFSRYLHIPTEMVLILFKQWGIQPEAGFQPQKGLQAFEVHSCSSCGICLDVCPGINLGMEAFQATYFVKAVRESRELPSIAASCLSCGACTSACPVGIHLEELRLDCRTDIFEKSLFKHAYLPIPLVLWRETTEVILFTGCMGRMNPKTTSAFKALLDEAGIPFVHIDEKEGVCCGRPMALAGAKEKGGTMMTYNRDLINGHNGKVLVTTCPICYRYFSEEYQLDIPVLHHSQYLWELMDKGLLKRERQNLKLSYHDPCDLGRGSGCYEAPRRVLRAIGHLVATEKEREKALCCGNNLGSLLLAESTRQQITAKTVRVLSQNKPDCIVTACPLCKPTLSKQSNVPVKDLAEVLLQAKQHGLAHLVSTLQYQNAEDR
jgi:Fe-S oxidoreductase